jgi:hypothetical protein
MTGQDIHDTAHQTGQREEAADLPAPDDKENAKSKASSPAVRKEKVYVA